MASIVMLLIIAGCAAFQYLKGTIVRAYATIIVALISTIAAFGFFEFLANLLISRSGGGSLVFLAPWAQPLCFVLLFILSFAVLQTGVVQLTQQPVNFGFLPERIGRIVCGIILGFIVSGLLFTCLQMCPIPAKYPYERFDPAKLDPENPNKTLLSPDGFVTGFFSLISKTSFSGKRSFAVIHPDYLSQLSLNRLISGKSLVTSTQAIQVTKPAVWPASDAIRSKVEGYISDLNSRGRLTDEETNKTVPMAGWTKGSYEPTIVRIGFKRGALSAEKKINAGLFSHTQLRLICKREGNSDNPLAGEAINVYPVGHLKSEDEIRIDPDVTLSGTDFGNDNTKDIDFVFCIPSGVKPILAEFKLNSITQITSGLIVSADQAPSAAIYNPSSN